MMILKDKFNYQFGGTEEEESDWDADDPNCSPFSGTGDSSMGVMNHDSGAGAGDGATKGEDDD